MKNKIFIISLLFLILNFKMRAQDKVSSIFKTLIILNGTLYLDENDKENELNSNFEELFLNINLDTEEVKSKYFLVPDYLMDFKIYSFDFEKSKVDVKKNLIYNLSNSTCSKYIIAYNKKLDRYYRLKGFKNNDYNSFFYDIIKYSNEKLKSNNVLKELKKMDYDDLDFDCIYKWMNSQKNNGKYPCISSCTDAKSAH